MYGRDFILLRNSKNVIWTGKPGTTNSALGKWKLIDIVVMTTCKVRGRILVTKELLRKEIINLQRPRGILVLTYHVGGGNF
jgi:hypothetical protein